MDDKYYNKSRKDNRRAQTENNSKENTNRIIPTAVLEATNRNPIEIFEKIDRRPSIFKTVKQL